MSRSRTLLACRNMAKFLETREFDISMGPHRITDGHAFHVTSEHPVLHSSEFPALLKTIARLFCHKEGQANLLVNVIHTGQDDHVISFMKPPAHANITPRKEPLPRNTGM